MVTYPLTLPTTKYPRKIRMYAINTVAVARSPYTHATQVQEFAGQSWSADVVYPEMERAEAEEFNAFLLALMGQKGTFYLSDPLSLTPRGLATGNPKVDGANQTGNRVDTKGWSTSVSGILLKGDCIQIGTGYHKILEDADSDGSGNATLEIWPRLADSPADEELVVTQNARGVFRLSQNIVPIYDTDEQKVYSISFSCVEAK